jgi:hypothetical protein
MVMPQRVNLGVFLQGMDRGHGERTDRNRTSDEEEPFVHDNSESQRYPNQQCNPCRIHCLFFELSHDASFDFLLQTIWFRPAEDTLHELLFSIQILFGVKAARIFPSIPGFAVVRLHPI